MLNNLDLLIVVFMVLATAGLLALCLMFLTRNVTIKKVSLYFASALAIYTGYVGLRIGRDLFILQSGIGIVVAIAALAAILLAATSKDDKKKFKTAQIVSAVALIVGMINAVL